MRYLTGLVILIAASMACSRGPDHPVAALPTSPSPIAASSINPVSLINPGRGVSGPMVVNMPNPADTFLFRNSLETGYANVLARSATNGIYVDLEGQAVWIQEYIRYRSNGCGHVEAISRVLQQIDGALARGICEAPSEFFEAAFPNRADVVDAMRLIDQRYQAMARALGLSTVDLEGAAIWIAEYLRYRANGCDHATAVEKVLVQLQGAPPPPTCFVPCSYVLAPGGLDTGPAPTNQSFEVRPSPVACPWTAETNVPWLTFPRGNEQGNGFFTFPYSVAQNLGGDRQGFILFRYATGTQTFRVFQSGSPFVAGITMVDPARGPQETTECHFRSLSTSCILRAFANLPGNVYTYKWVVKWFNGGEKVGQLTAIGASTFTITDTCGAAGSDPSGPATEISVDLTITDDRNNSVPVLTGANTPALFSRAFKCGA
jgi:hypothetical protein